MYIQISIYTKKLASTQGCDFLIQKTVTTRPPLLLDHCSGGAVEGDLDDGQRVVALVGHGLEGAGDSAVGLGVTEGSEALGDCLLDLGHADIAHGHEGCLVEGLGIEFTDPSAGSAQEVAQALGPDVVVGVLDELHPQVPGTDAVQPVVRAIDAQAGLVGVQGGHLWWVAPGCWTGLRSSPRPVHPKECSCPV